MNTIEQELDSIRNSIRRISSGVYGKDVVGIAEALATVQDLAEAELMRITYYGAIYSPSPEVKRV